MSEVLSPTENTLNGFGAWAEHAGGRTSYERTLWNYLFFCIIFKLGFFCFSSFAHSHSYSITVNSPTMTWHFHTWVELVTRLDFVVGSWQCKVCFMPSPTDSDISILTYSSSNKCIDMFKLALQLWKGLYIFLIDVMQFDWLNIIIIKKYIRMGKVSIQILLSLACKALPFKKLNSIWGSAWQCQGYLNVDMFKSNRSHYRNGMK